MALSGVPLLSGFFSKDEILYAVFEHGDLFLWLLAVVTAGLSAFYAFRLLFVAFYGKSRMSKKTESHIHESPPVMVVPMVILAVLAVLGGYIGLPKVLKVGNAVEGFLHPVFADVHLREVATIGTGLEWGLILVSVVAAALGILAAYWLYVRNWGLAERMTNGARWLYDLVYDKYYVDEAYMAGVVQPLRLLGGFLADAVEERSIDGAVNGLARLVGLAGEGLRRLQTGLVRNYALAMFVGAVVVLVYFVVWSLLGI
jgi:NADH-quinone oxidoreductase subunit L